MSSLLDAIRGAVGAEGLLVGEEVRSRPATLLGGECQAVAIVRPANTEELARVMALCHAAGQPVVPLGGMSGLVGGGLANEREIVVSLERMTAIEELDTVGRTATVQAGVPLEVMQEKAKEAGLAFTVDFGARGNATIGGAIATNAGGNSVLRYGMMRENVLGLEAVLSDGTVVSSLSPFIKNNAGYDIKHLFIGSEGTLGIVTRAALRLRPLPRSSNTALLAATDFAHVTRLLSVLDGDLGGSLTCFEVMWNEFFRTIVQGSKRHEAPLPTDHPYYVLVEATGADPEADAERFQATMERALAQGLVADAVVAQSTAQRDALWAIRDDIGTLIRKLWPLFSFDVSLRLQDIEDYVAEVKRRLAEQWPEARCVVFGHLGDGNIHLTVSVGSDDPAIHRQVDEIVYGSLRTRGGSVSAEHGIGLEKRAFLSYSRSPNEVALMKRVKTALDPKGILNPGKVLS